MYKQLPLFELVQIIDGLEGKPVFKEPMVRTAAQDWVRRERAAHGQANYALLLIVSVSC